MGVRVTRNGRADYRQDYGGVGDMLTAPFMINEMFRRAKKIVPVAEALSPVDTSDYVNRFSVKAGIRRKGKARAVGTVENDSRHAFFIEFGNRKIRQHRVLGKAMHAAGDR